MRIFAIGENINQLSEFRDVFGMRYVGLVDGSGVYQEYRVPNPQAPYPQDHVIDQQGVVRYWSDQFDPQEVIRVIDRLLGTGVEQRDAGWMIDDDGATKASPNPFRSQTIISLRVAADEPGAIAVLDAAGRLVRSLAAAEPPNSGSVTWDGTDDTGQRLPSGVYHVRSRAARAVPVLLLR